MVGAPSCHTSGMRIHAVALAVLLGCGSGQKADPVVAEAPAPAPDAAPAEPVEAPPASSEIPADLIAAFEAELAFLELMTDAFERGGEDCEQSAANLRHLADGPQREAIGKSEAHPAYATHEAALEQRYADQIDVMMKRLMVSLDQCGEHPAVVEILTELGLY